jgi:hypothetical protein
MWSSMWIRMMPPSWNWSFPGQFSCSCSAALPKMMSMNLLPLFVFLSPQTDDGCHHIKRSLRSDSLIAAPSGGGSWVTLAHRGGGGRRRTWPSCMPWTVRSAMVAAEDLKCRGDFSSDAPARVGLQIFNEAIYNTRFETAKSTSALVDKN